MNRSLFIVKMIKNVGEKQQSLRKKPAINTYFIHPCDSIKN